MKIKLDIEDIISDIADEVKAIRKEDLEKIKEKLHSIDKKVSMATLRINGAWGAIVVLGGGLWYIVQTMLSK